MIQLSNSDAKELLRYLAHSQKVLRQKVDLSDLNMARKATALKVKLEKKLEKGGAK